MGNGRSRLEWRQTASQMALFANANREPGSRPAKVDDFDPFAEREADIEVDASFVKAMFLPGK